PRLPPRRWLRLRRGALHRPLLHLLNAPVRTHPPARANNGHRLGLPLPLVESTPTTAWLGPGGDRCPGPRRLLHLYRPRDRAPRRRAGRGGPALRPRLALPR